MKRLLLFLSLCFICSAAIAHTINWYVDGSIYHTTTCESGDDITPPTAPEKYGYTFKRWEGYTSIEYLESTGTQYIDTGYIPNQDTGVKTKGMFNSVINNEASMFGSGQSYDNRTFELYIWDQKLSFNYFNRNYMTDSIEAGDTVVIDWNKNIINYSKNDAPYVEIVRQYGDFVSPHNMLMFANQRPEGITAGKVKIYYFKIYDNGTLVRDFVPVLDKDSVPCMYDLVEHKFYYNAGTGNFVAGPIIGE